MRRQRKFVDSGCENLSNFSSTSAILFDRCEYLKEKLGILVLFRSVVCSVVPFKRTFGWREISLTLILKFIDLPREKTFR